VEVAAGVAVGYAAAAAAVGRAEEGADEEEAVVVPMDEAVRKNEPLVPDRYRVHLEGHAPDLGQVPDQDPCPEQTCASVRVQEDLRELQEVVELAAFWVFLAPDQVYE
jgi:hypothetical protein